MHIYKIIVWLESGKLYQEFYTVAENPGQARQNLVESGIKVDYRARATRWNTKQNAGQIIKTAIKKNELDL